MSDTVNELTATSLPTGTASGIWNHDFGEATYVAGLFVAFLGTFFALEAGRPVQEIWDSWRSDLERFRETRAKYLIY